MFKQCDDAHSIELPVLEILGYTETVHSLKSVNSVYLIGKKEKGLNVLIHLNQSSNKGGPKIITVYPLTNLKADE